MSTDGDLGEAEERFTTIRRYGKNLNVYRVHEVGKPKIHYVIKKYNTKKEYETEKMMLDELSGSKNIMQMVDFYQLQEIIVCECALYHLETFLGHQNYFQRDEEKGDIIKDIVSGLSELHKHDIVHTDLTPKNIMYFQERNYDSWKLIDFDSACIVNRDRVKITSNYSAPEVIRANENETAIKAEFAMDMFSFGLILYFLETGDHYWDEENEEKKEEMISNESLPLDDIHDANACFVINKLLNKNIPRRMTLKDFTQSLYYASKSNKQINNKKGRPRTNTNKEKNIQADYETRYEMSKAEIRLHERKLSQEAFQAFLEKYHDEMKQSLIMMNDKIDNCTRAVEDLSVLTKKIPQWLVKLKNEKVPRVFIMVPDQKDWKKPATWLSSKPFRLLFVCEHKEQWHIPKQEGYKILKVTQFIKKYGPWINLCLQTLCSVIRIMTSNVFPQAIADNLPQIFNVADNSDLMRHFQEVIDTVDIGVKNIADEDPDFIPLSNENHPYQIINSSGLRKLEKFLDTQKNTDYGGLVQCVDNKTQEILWLCEEHRDEYCVKPTGHARTASSPVDLTPSSSRSYSSQSSRSSGSLNSKHFPSRSLDTSNYFESALSSSPPSSPLSLTPPSSPPSSSSSFSISNETNLKWDFSKFDKENLTDPLDPFFALEYVRKILGEVVDNAISSGRKHFRRDVIKKIAHDMNGYMNRFKTLCPNWNNNAQKLQFISILRNQVHLYIHFLRSIVRYCVVKDYDSATSLAKKMSFLREDLIEINGIIKAGKSFNSHLHKLVTAMEANNHKDVAIKLDGFAKDPDLKVNIDDDSIVVNYEALSRWYLAVDRTHMDVETPSTLQGLFNTTKRLLDNNTDVTGKSLTNPKNKTNFLCTMKEIYLYNEHNLNANNHIIEFRGYSIHDCKSTLFYDYADHGNLFEYFQENHNSSENLLKGWKEKTKLAWEISQGVKYLHDRKIIHLDLRSENILLKYDEMEKALKPKISNFLRSRYLYANKTSVHPKSDLPTEEKIWKRWYDPDRLHTRDVESRLQPSDIYSLGLLFWEISWCKAGNLPFKDIPIKSLYNHLRNNNYENLPKIPREYQRWERLIIKMWQFKQGDRCDIMTVESDMQRLFRGRTNSMASVISYASY